MYFLNKVHETNFNYLSNDFYIQSRDLKEYAIISYVFALPEIFKRFEFSKMNAEFPFLWVYDYEDLTTIEEHDDHRYYNFNYKIPTDDFGEKRYSTKFLLLPEPYQNFVWLAQNMYNSGIENFNLAEAIRTWDDALYQVFHQVLEIMNCGNFEIVNIKKIDFLAVQAFSSQGTLEQRFTHLLINRGMTKKRLSEETGLGSKNIDLYLKGKSIPSATRAIVLSKSLGVSVEKLYGEFANEEKG